MKKDSTIRKVKVVYVGSENDFANFVLQVVRDKVNGFSAHRDCINRLGVE